MLPPLKLDLERFQSQKKQFKELLKKLKKEKRLDYLFLEAHENVFSTLSCLDCANCCKTISPIFKQKDIERLSRRLKMKPYQFIELYLYEDLEGDYVLKEKPCPFLMHDNYCSVYEDRPTACKGYPHTNHVNMKKHLSLAAKNCETCPAVVRILEEIKIL